MGHIQAGHVRWLALIRRIGSVPEKMGFLSRALARPALLPLMRFAKECEMTADNAGLICAQDQMAVERMVVRIATGIEASPDNAVNVEAYLKQGRSQNLSKASDCISTWRSLSAPVPFAPERIRQMRDFRVSRRFQDLWH
jgi:Zn-dependent protease with chaperone function